MNDEYIKQIIVKESTIGNVTHISNGLSPLPEDVIKFKSESVGPNNLEAYCSDITPAKNTNVTSIQGKKITLYPTNPNVILGVNTPLGSYSSNESVTFTRGEYQYEIFYQPRVQKFSRQKSKSKKTEQKTAEDQPQS